MCWFSLCCCLLFRHPLHRAAHQSCWRDWSHTHGSVVWVWCRQLSLHIHVLFPQVSTAVDLLLRYLQELHHTVLFWVSTYITYNYPESCFLHCYFHRNVTDSDILALERRLLQTMDMIVSKKKR